MGLFGPPDIEKLKSKRDVKGLLAALKYRNSAAVRKNAALAISDLTALLPAKEFEPAVAPLIETFEDTDSSVVNACVQALSSIGQPAFIPLVSTLRASRDQSREAAARAIGRIAINLSDPTLLKFAVDPLVGLLHDPAVSPRRSAGWSLGRLSPRLDPSQRNRIVESLALALRDPAAEVRETAASSLGRTGESQAIRPLVAALEDRSTAVRKIASEGLDLLGWSPTVPKEMINYRIARQDWEGAVQAGPSSAAALIRVMGGSDQTSRLAAIRVLGRTGSIEAIGPLVAALKDPDEAVRVSAAAALEQAGAPDAVDALLQASRDRDREVRKAVALALAHTNDERAIPPILIMLRTREPDMVEIAGKALIGLGPLSVSYLIQMLTEPDTPIQELASQILTRTGPPAVPPLSNLLREGRPPANQLAANILGDIKDPRAVWPLISALQITELTIPSAHALGKIGDPRAVKPLLDLLNSSFSEAVQQETALALGSIGDPQALDPLIQLLRASDREIRSDAAKALILMYRSGKLDLVQKRKIFEQQDRIIEKHTDSRTHQDETRGSDWHIDQSFHEDTGIGLDFPAPYR
jgi:HEAT repeat protein